MQIFHIKLILIILGTVYHGAPTYAESNASLFIQERRTFEAESHFGFSRETLLKNSELNNQGGSHICLDLWNTPKDQNYLSFGIRTLGSGIIKESSQLSRISTGLISSLNLESWLHHKIRLLSFLGLSSQTIRIHNSSAHYGKAFSMGAGWEKSRSIVDDKLEFTWGMMVYVHDWNQESSSENLEASVHKTPSSEQYRSITQSIQMGLLFRL